MVLALYSSYQSCLASGPHELPLPGCWGIQTLRAPEALGNRVRNCRRCGLGKGRRSKVTFSSRYNPASFPYSVEERCRRSRGLAALVLKKRRRVTESRGELAFLSSSGPSAQTQTPRAFACCGRVSNLGFHSFLPQVLLLSLSGHRVLATRYLRGKTVRPGRWRRWPPRQTADARPLGAATGLGASLRLPTPAPNPGHRLKSGLGFLVLRKAQETVYFGDKINSPRTVNLHLCKLHYPHPTRDRWPRLLRPAVI